MPCACCPHSDWHWFRWVLAAQPVFGAALYLWAYG